MEDSKQQVSQGDSLNQSPPPVNPPLHQKRNVLLLIGAIVFIFVITGGAYYFGTRKSTVPSPNPTVTSQTPQASSTPTSLPDETANWKTYTNDNLKISLKYPTDKFVRLNCPGDEANYFYLLKRANETQDVIEMPTCARDSRYTLEITSTTAKLDEPISNEYVTVTSKVITVDNTRAIKYTYTKTSTPSPSPEWSTQVVLVHNNLTYIIYFDEKPLEETFNQILSTFRFTQ